MTPDHLVHVEAIRGLKARYFRLLDQRLWDEWAAVFTDDVYVDVSNDSGRIVRGKEHFAPHVQRMLTGAITMHHGHMAEIAITSPTTASGIWSMEDNIEWPEGSPRRRLRGMGWYEEQYRLGDDDRWRIAEMVLRRQWVEIDGVRVFPPAPAEGT